MRVIHDEPFARSQLNSRDIVAALIIPTLRILGGVIHVCIKKVTLGVRLLDIDVARTLRVTRSGRLPSRSIRLKRGDLLEVHCRRADVLEGDGEEAEARRNRDILEADDVRARNVRVRGGSYCAAVLEAG